MKTLKLFPFLLVLVLLTVPALSQKRLPVINMHICAPLDLPAGALAPCLPHPCIRKGQASGSSAVNLKKTLEAMDRCNIVKGFLIDLDLGELRQRYRHYYCGIITLKDSNI